MKVKAIVLGILLVLGVLGISLAINQTEVPQEVMDAFSMKYPDAKKVDWEMEEEGEYEAEFILEGKKMSANFNSNGQWLQTERAISHQDLPQAVQVAILQEFPGYTTEEAEHLTTPDLPEGYEVELQNKKDDVEIEAVFDSKGSLLKKEIKSERNDQEKEDNEK